MSNLDYAKDTLVKEIVNDELIDKAVAVIAEDEIQEGITVHVVKIIVPFLFGAPRCPR